MSDATAVQGPTVKPSDKATGLYNGGKVSDFFYQRELLPISFEESVLVLILGYKEETEEDRTYDNAQTGKPQSYPAQTKVLIAGGMQLLIRGLGHIPHLPTLPKDSEGRSVGVFALVQIDTVINKQFGSVKHYLKKWRGVDDIRSLSDGRLIGLPLLHHRQLVCSTVQGYDFNSIEEIIKA